MAGRPLRRARLNASRYTKETGKLWFPQEQYDFDSMAREKLPNGKPRYYFIPTDIKPDDDVPTRSTFGGLLSREGQERPMYPHARMAMPLSELKLYVERERYDAPSTSVVVVEATDPAGLKDYTTSGNDIDEDKKKMEKKYPGKSFHYALLREGYTSVQDHHFGYGHGVLSFLTPKAYRVVGELSLVDLIGRKQETHGTQGQRTKYIESVRRDPKAMRTIQKAVADMVPIPGTKFALGKYEVTQELYQAVIGSSPAAWSTNPEEPVAGVSLSEANTFCNSLGRLTGYRFRLPTLAEWMYAARGGESYKYAGSNNLDEVAWYYRNAPHDAEGMPLPAAVGLKKPNGYGLYDMTGNVEEWTSTLYREDDGLLPPPDRDEDGDFVNVKDQYRVGSVYCAGGSCLDDPASLVLDAAYRLVRPESRGVDIVGFRIAMNLPHAVPKKNPRRGWYR